MPIEAVMPGDSQVLAAGYPESWCIEPVISLDVLQQFPDVTSVVASTIVRAHSPIPTVRQLILLHETQVPDGATLRNLPCLASLFAGMACNDSLLDVAALPKETLMQLTISRNCLEGLSSISSLVNLRELEIRSSRRGDSLRGLGTLPELRRLKISPGGLGNFALKGWKSLRTCTKLEDAELHRFNAQDLRPFSSWRSLRRLKISGKLNSLSGIESFMGLEEFVITNEMPLDDLTPLCALPRLAILSLSIPELSDVSFLKQLPELTQLKLFAQKSSRIDSLRALEGCKTLESLHVANVLIDDKDLSVLLEMPRLRKLAIDSDDGSLTLAVDQFRRLRPDVLVHYEAVAKKATPTLPAIKVGEVGVFLPTEDARVWTIFGDMTHLLGCRSNSGVEKRVRQFLKNDRMLLKRLFFDTEADNFSVDASSEEDIRAVAGAINALASRHRELRAARRNKG